MDLIHPSLCPLSALSLLSSIIVVQILKTLISSSKDVCKRHPTESETILRSYGRMCLMVDSIVFGGSTETQIRTSTKFIDKFTD